MHTHLCDLFCGADAVGLSSTRLSPSPSSPPANRQKLKDQSSCGGLDPECHPEHNGAIVNVEKEAFGLQPSSGEGGSGGKDNDILPH